MTNSELQKRIDLLENRVKALEEKEPQHHEFKVGDRVKFKSWDEMEKEFGADRDCYLYVGFSKEMKHLCNTYATIEKIYDDFHVELDNFTANGDIFWDYNLDMLKPATDEPRWAFTDDEKVILRNLPEKYKWIARDKIGNLTIYCDKKPHKNDIYENWVNSSDRYSAFLFNHLFQSIKWTDEEPCEFRKYL